MNNIPNITPFNAATLTATVVNNNASIGGEESNIILFDLKLQGNPLSNMRLTISLNANLTYPNSATTDANGQVYIQVKSDRFIGDFMGYVIFTADMSIYTTFTITFIDRSYPVVISERSLYFDTAYKGIHHFLPEIYLSSARRYVIELSRKPSTTIICAAANANYVAAGSPAVCLVTQPLAFESLNETGLDVLTLRSGLGNTMYGRYRYAFAVAGYTVVTVTDYGPFELGYFDSSPSPIQQGLTLEHEIQDQNSCGCPQCGCN